MWNRTDSRLFRYGSAVAGVVLATAVRLLFDPVLGDKFPFATMFFAVMVVSWYGGFGPAVAATVLGGLASAWLFLPPRGSYTIAGVDNQVGMGLFLTMCAGICLLGGAMRRAQRRAEETSRELLVKQREIEIGAEERQQAQHRERSLLIEASTADAKFRAFFEQGPLFAGIMALDGTILEPNRLALDACGYTREQVVGKLFWECPWWNQSPELMDQIKQASAQAAAGQVYRAEMPFYVADGSRRMVDFILLPIKNESGRTLFLAPTGTDITQRHQLENDLRKSAAELAEADRRKDEFLATLAHELRNPLAPLRNGLQLMRLSDGESETIEQARTMMERQLTHLIRLIDDLMDVNRITRGRLELRKEPLELEAVVNMAVETSLPLIEAMGHQLTVTLPERPVLIEADLTRVAQVLSNLLNNAAKYSDRCSQIRLAAEQQAGDLVVSVRDNGIGIARDKLSGIFEMFSQVDHSLERSQGGLGIGLTLVKWVVEKHGGKIEAHSAGLGTGSEFVIRLPVVIRPPADVPADARRPEATDKSLLRILIVDDNRDGADSLATMLRLMGNDTRTAYDGEQALVLAEEYRPDVMLLDLGLPKLNGYDACRRIRQQPREKDLLIIAQTGWGQDEDRRRTYEAGFDHHMVKPVDPTALLRMLADLQQARP
ncbi:MAG TPA: ATP-binding protein [Pirellulales bacterium]|jgi:PAS domain S-box-containing protein